MKQSTYENGNRRRNIYFVNDLRELMGRLICWRHIYTLFLFFSEIRAIIFIIILFKHDFTPYSSLSHYKIYFYFNRSRCICFVYIRNRPEIIGLLNRQFPFLLRVCGGLMMIITSMISSSSKKKKKEIVMICAIFNFLQLLFFDGENNVPKRVQ